MVTIYLPINYYITLLVTLTSIKCITVYMNENFLVENTIIGVQLTNSETLITEIIVIQSINSKYFMMKKLEK